MKIFFKLFLVFLIDFNLISSCKDELIESVVSNNKYAVKKILDKGCDANSKNKAGASALILAIYNQNLDIIKYLLENGANPNSSLYNVKALKFAKNFKRKDIEDLLLKYKAED